MPITMPYELYTTQCNDLYLFMNYSSAPGRSALGSPGGAKRDGKRTRLAHV